MEEIEKIIESLSKTWSANRGRDDPNELYFFQQNFPPDGIDVIISIHKISEAYEVWSSVEHRVSGPNDNLIGTAQSLEAVLKIAEIECYNWEKFFRESSSNY